MVAALLHYFLTAVFTWMLCEGVLIYFHLVKILSVGLGEKKLFYIALGWGMQFLIHSAFYSRYTVCVELFASQIFSNLLKNAIGGILN